MSNVFKSVENPSLLPSGWDTMDSGRRDSSTVVCFRGPSISPDTEHSKMTGRMFLCEDNGSGVITEIS